MCACVEKCDAASASCHAACSGLTWSVDHYNRPLAGTAAQHFVHGSGARAQQQLRVGASAAYNASTGTFAGSLQTVAVSEATGELAVLESRPGGYTISGFPAGAVKCTDGEVGCLTYFSKPVNTTEV